MKSILLLLLAFVATTSILSGFLLIANPGGEILKMSTSLLEHTPFRDFRIPGLVLATIVGSTNLVAVIYYLQLREERYNWALLGGLMMAGWIIVQILLIREINWLQVLYLVISIGIILLSFHLKVKSLVWGHSIEIILFADVGHNFPLNAVLIWVHNYTGLRCVINLISSFTLKLS